MAAASRKGSAAIQVDSAQHLSYPFLSEISSASQALPLFEVLQLPNAVNMEEEAERRINYCGASYRPIGPIHRHALIASWKPPARAETGSTWDWMFQGCSRRTLVPIHSHLKEGTGHCRSSSLSFALERLIRGTPFSGSCSIAQELGMTLEHMCSV
jgi:hypothetical protein